MTQPREMVAYWRIMMKNWARLARMARNRNDMEAYRKNRAGWLNARNEARL